MMAIGDTIFAIGILALGWFVLGLKTGWSVNAGTSDITPDYPHGAPAPFGK